YHQITAVLSITIILYTSLFRSFEPLPRTRPMSTSPTTTAPAEPIGCSPDGAAPFVSGAIVGQHAASRRGSTPCPAPGPYRILRTDRKSTRLNSSHVKNSYAVLC